MPYEFITDDFERELRSKTKMLKCLRSEITVPKIATFEK